MSKRRHYRITEEDVSDLRERTRGQVSFDNYSKWVKRVAELDPLIYEITEAFQGITLGDGIGLLEANGIDDRASAAERAELRSRDEKTDWRKIDAKLLNYCNASPAYFDARGFWFHLPAFLIAELNDDYYLDFVEPMISDLQVHREWNDLLTQPQRTVITKTLELLRNYPDFMELETEIEVGIERLQNLADETTDQ